MVKVKPETVSTAAFAAAVMKSVSGVHDTAFLKRPRMPRCACYTQQIPQILLQLAGGRQLDSERGCPGMPASMRTQFGLRPCPLGGHGEWSAEPPVPLGFPPRNPGNSWQWMVSPAAVTRWGSPLADRCAPGPANAGHTIAPRVRKPPAASDKRAAGILRYTRALMAIYPNFVDPNRPNPNGSDDASFIIYGYVPSLVLAVIGVVFYGLCLLGTLAIFVRIRRYVTRADADLRRSELPVCGTEQRTCRLQVGLAELPSGHRACL